MFKQEEKKGVSGESEMIPYFIGTVVLLPNVVSHVNVFGGKKLKANIYNIMFGGQSYIQLIMINKTFKQWIKNA